ncbi:MAG: alpha/beta fold hydrolase [Gaiellales bacterium]
MLDDIEVGQRSFDPLGPRVHTARLPTGRIVRYIDEGDPSWPAALFFGGAGTSVRAFRLLEFARTLREELGIRVVSVERNGLGETPFDPAVGFAEHAADVGALLDRLGVGEVAIVAISGGGPYAAHVAAAHPRLVRSLHLACAFSERLPEAPIEVSLDAVAADPAGWWRYPEASPVHRIPGFADSTVEEATRAAFALGRDTPPDGLEQAFRLYRDTPLPDLRQVQAPAFLYWGSADGTVPVDHLERWREALPNVREVRIYQGERHDVQYRHWDQILVDIAHLGRRIVVCSDGRTLLVSPQRATALVGEGAILGLCAWS